MSLGRRLALMQCECQPPGPWTSAGDPAAGYGEAMERSELDTLLSPKVLAAVDEEPAPTATTDVLARSTALRRAGVPPDGTAIILTQAKLRRRAGAQIGPLP